MALHLPRRGLIRGALALLAAPAIIRTPGLLMPIRVPREDALLTDTITITWNEVPLATGYHVYKSSSIWLINWDEQTSYAVSPTDPLEYHPA